MEISLIFIKWKLTELNIDIKAFELDGHVRISNGWQNQRAEKGNKIMSYVF